MCIPRVNNDGPYSGTMNDILLTAYNACLSLVILFLSPFFFFNTDGK